MSFWLLIKIWLCFVGFAFFISLRPVIYGIIYTIDFFIRNHMKIKMFLIKRNFDKELRKLL